MEELISIIVPVYNCINKNLEKCLDSLKNQTYHDIEILLIDDGSTDGSQSLCDQYVNEDPRFKVHHLKNGGVSNARNYGLNIFSGEYCSFVDGDDVVAKDYIELLYRTVKRQNTLIAVCDAYEPEYSPDFNWIYETRDSQLLNLDDSYRFYTGKVKHYTVWGALYHRSVLENIRFSEAYTNGEDLLFFVKAMMTTKTMSYIPMPLYCYIKYNNSAVNRPYGEQRYTEILAWEEVRELVKDLPGLWRNEAELGYLSMCFFGYRSLIWQNDYDTELYNVLRKKVLKGLITYLTSNMSTRNKFVYTTVSLFPALYAKIHGILAKSKNWKPL